ncbi:MAG: cytochrome c-type biogenesis protein CcmH [Deltaproteobacteria bacterium]|nr:MAG: cytochrome c-type biogenesis protein CcmH [Deltaproteobacteria bacterium]
MNTLLLGVLLFGAAGEARADEGAASAAASAEEPSAASAEEPSAEPAEEPSAAGDEAAPVGLDEPPAGPPPPTEAEIDRLTEEISKGLRCPVCQGLSVADSPADGARAMKHRVRELVSLGYDRQQIEDYFVDRYGVWILLAPPEKGRHWLVYLAPVGFLLAGVGGIWFLVRTRAEEELDEAPPADPGATSSADPLEPYRQRILAELGLSGPGGRS